MLYNIVISKQRNDAMFTEQINIIKSVTDITPEIAIVLGSGLGGLADMMQDKAIIPYRDIPGMPISTAPGHEGNFVFGKINSKSVVIMQGRVHLYEGLKPADILIPIRILKDLGVKSLILTNAAGGINKDFDVGDLMLISDHISCFIDSCLIGKNDDEYGVRFPDMSNAYDKDIQKIITDTAYENGIELKKGVYVQLKGPQFETPAEITMLARFGADAVGMSTVIETIAAKHSGMKVGAISMISNMACGILDTPLSGDDVNEAAKNSAPKLEKLISQVIQKL